MKLQTYKLIPTLTELICDCGGKMKKNGDAMDLFTSLLSGQAYKFQYKCDRCGKVFESSTNYKINEVQHMYEKGDLIEEKEVK